MDLTQQAHALGVATGRRELTEQVIGELRKSSARWRASEAKPAGVLGSLRAAFCWALTERWVARVDELAGQLEQDLGRLRSAEQQAQSQYQAALVAPVAAPPPLKRLRKPRSGK